MANAAAPESTTSRFRSAKRRLSARQQVALGVGALALTKGADVVTTIGGLQFTSVLRESNPLAAAAMHQIGVLPALLGLGTVTILFVTLMTEGGVRILEQHPEAIAGEALGVRLLGYGVASTVNLSVATHNVLLVLTV